MRISGRKSQQASFWAKQACTLLVHGKIEELVEAISKLPKIPLAEGESRSVSDRAVDYFTTNAERMRYSAFRAQSMHIGSGIAEAACKTMVETRAKETGMRWTISRSGCSFALACSQTQWHIRCVLGGSVSLSCLTPTTNSYTR